MFTTLRSGEFQQALTRSVSHVVKLMPLTLALFLLTATPTWADVYGRVAGIVKDPSGASVPDATVTLLDVDKGVKQETTTDAQGAYAFPAVPVGHYELAIHRAGFADERESGLVIDVNTVRIVDVSLKLMADVQEVRVSISPVQVETASTQVGEVISDQRMESVPLNGRSYTDLLSL